MNSGKLMNIYTHTRIYIVFISTMKCEVESRPINEIKEKLRGIRKLITPRFLFFSCLKRGEPQPSRKALSEQRHQLGCNSPITGL